MLQQRGSRTFRFARRRACGGAVLIRPRRGRRERCAGIQGRGRRSALPLPTRLGRWRGIRRGLLLPPRFCGVLLNVHDLRFRRHLGSRAHCHPERGHRSHEAKGDERERQPPLLGGHVLQGRVPVVYGSHPKPRSSHGRPDLDRTIHYAHNGVRGGRRQCDRGWRKWSKVGQRIVVARGCRWAGGYTWRRWSQARGWRSSGTRRG